MRGHSILVGITAALLGACASAPASDGTNADSTAARQPAPPPLSRDMLPRGTEIEVVLNDTLDAEDARVGDRFSATVRTPIKTVSGFDVVPAGAVVTGLVTGVDDSDHAGDPAYLRLNFIRLTLGEANHPFAAEIAATDLGSRSGASVEDAKDSAAVGAVAGAVVGAIIGGDLLAALEGASLGAGAGSVIALGTASERLPAGTVLLLRTTANISLEQ